MSHSILRIFCFWINTAYVEIRFSTCLFSFVILQQYSVMRHVSTMNPASPPAHWSLVTHYSNPPLQCVHKMLVLKVRHSLYTTDLISYTHSGELQPYSYSQSLQSFHKNSIYYFFVLALQTFCNNELLCLFSDIAK